MEAVVDEVPDVAPAVGPGLPVDLVPGRIAVNLGKLQMGEGRVQIAGRAETRDHGAAGGGQLKRAVRRDVEHIPARGLPGLPGAGEAERPVQTDEACLFAAGLQPCCTGRHETFDGRILESEFRRLDPAPPFTSLPMQPGRSIIWPVLNVMPVRIVPDPLAALRTRICPGSGRP